MSLLGRLAWVFLGLWLLALAPAYSQVKEPAKPWTGKLADGRVITKQDLDKILQDHVRWLGRGKKGEGRANLSKAKLWKANLSKAHLFKANLSGAYLLEANLSGAKLEKANLRGADLLKTDLSQANLSMADLRKADLRKADLRQANLHKANLTKADLSGTNLTGSRMSQTIFEPKKGGFLPKGNLLSGISGLASLKYVNSPHGLVTLREVYKKLGESENERAITYSIHRNKREISWRKGHYLESLFNLIFFEWTCDYGMRPGRLLKIIGLGLFFFTLPYLLALWTLNPRSGIWLLLPESKDRVLDRKLVGRPFKLTTRPPLQALPSKTWPRLRARLRRGWRALRLAFYFSLLSAFRLGWRELNVGTWISRLQKREYTLRATGWVRSISGLQSLLSVYLLALWVLTYFGRFFE